MARDIEAIYQEMLAAFAAERGETIEAGCDLAVRLHAAAAQIQALEMQADWVLDQSFPQTARGAYLDRHAQARNVERSPAVKAKGVLRFRVDAAVTEDLAIPAGCVALTAAGERFVTTEDAVLRQGEQWAEAAAEAVEPGAAGNVAAGAVGLMAVAPAGVKSCVNPHAFAGGADEEDDESLRRRILDTYRRLPNGANGAYYEQQTMAFASVAAAKAVGRPRGVGSVDVYIATQEGLPGSGLLEQVRDWLEERREIAVDLRVLAPTAATVNVSASLKPAAGYTFAQARTAADQAVRGAFTGELLGKGLTLAALGHLLYGLDEVENYHLHAPAADTPPAPGALPVLGSLTLTEMEAV